jgi:hypothetical protein
MRTVGIVRRRWAIVVLCAVVAAAGCSSDGGDDAAGAGEGGEAEAGDEASSEDGTTGDEADEAAELPEGYEGFTSDQYADDAHWLCKPGIADDVCSRDLDATAVAPDGSTEVVEHVVAEDPAVDCFYVYPTTSFDPGPNSDLEPAENAEIATVYNQVARLTSTCRVFAPVYRQLTLSVIGGGGGSAEEGVDPGAVAYGDVLAAFMHYVANDSDGHGFVLIGHSQGAGMLTRLIDEEIDDEPLLRERLVSAYILGSAVEVPDGEVVGGTFDSVPLCEAPDETGCVVSYASFRSTSPPVAGSFFGRGGEGTHAACVNPADVTGGGPAPLHPYFSLDQPPGTLLGGPPAEPFAEGAAVTADDITTPWVTYDDLVEGTCVAEGEFSYLELSVQGDPADPRTDDIGGNLTPEWGMHLIDANVAMGDIEALVAEQAEAYAG